MSTKTPIRILTAMTVAGLALASMTGCTLIDALAGGEPTQTPPETPIVVEETPTTDTPSPPPVTPTPTTEPTEAGQLTNFFDLKVGDCFDIPDDANGNALLFSTCDVLHTYEAYSIETMPGDSTFPGEGAVSDYAETTCLDAFQAYVGKSYATSFYGVYYITPSKETWEGVNDREVLCLVYPYDGTQSTGSAKDSRK